MTCNIASVVQIENYSIWNKETEINIVHAKKCFYVTHEFYNIYGFLCTEDEPNFPRQNNLILQKKVSGLDKVLSIKDFSRPNEEIKYFSRTSTKFKDFSRRL